MQWFSGMGRGIFVRSASALLLTLPLSVSACSDENAPADAQAGGAHAAGAAGGSAGGASGAAGSSAAGSPSAEKTGSVVVSGRAFGGPASLAAQFILTAELSACEQVSYGDCILSDICTGNDTATTYSSAGTVSLTSASPAIDVSIEPDSSGRYQPANLTTPFVGGEMLHVDATGGEVPAFSNDLKVPLLLVVDQPAADSTGLIQAPTTQNLVLSFSRGADRVSLRLLGGSSTKSLSCIAQSSSSTLIVAAAALEALGSGAQLKAYTVGIANAATPGWNVQVGTVTEAITPDHKAAITIKVE